MSLMANPRKPKASGPAADRHLHPKLTLRLPGAEGEALRRMASAEERTLTAIVLRALRAYAREHGHPWPGLPEAPVS